MRSLALLVLVAAGCGEGVPTIPTDTGGTVNDIDRDGFSSAQGDCNDNDARTYPGAWDIVGDSTDQNCDGIDGVDGDGDDVAWTGSGGEDCNDDDPTIYLGAEEIGWDGIDQDCNLVDRYDFDQLCAGEDHTCGIDSTGRIRCWGIDDVQTRNVPPNDGTVWISLSCGMESACAVSETGQLSCWGRETAERGLMISSTPTEQGSWKAVFVGGYHACAINEANAATCWGWDEDGQVSRLPNGALFPTGMGLGLEHSCGIRGSRRVMECWGAEGAGNLIATTPSDQYFDGFIQVTGGDGFACTIRQNLGIDCWGDDLNNNAWRNQAGPFGQVAAGNRFVCAIKELAPVCVGEENPFQVINRTPTETDLRFITAGEGHACGIRQRNGEVICWGKDDSGQATVPDWGG